MKPVSSVSHFIVTQKQHCSLHKYFDLEGQLVYCNNIEELLLTMALPAYYSSEWRHFIDSFKRSLKYALLPN